MDEKKEYIERGALIEWSKRCKNACIEVYKGLNNDIEKHAAEEAIAAYDDCIGYVESVPAADVVEVVRCKDCKNVKMLVDIIGEPHLFCCNGRSINRMKVELDDYCSYGERKEE